MSINIDDVFSDLYPGSKRRRRDPLPVAEKSDDVAWDSNPTVKMHNGQPTQFFNTGALAKALGKATVSVRLWERKGYIPQAPYRLPGFVNSQGKQVPGRRLYSRELIEIAIEEFAKRDLLGKTRVEWKEHTDLTIAIAERWTTALTKEK